jgi:HlyD family secretion protein
MIKNTRLVMLALTLGCTPGGGGCSEAGAEAPLQGVVEYDERLLGFELGGRVLEVPVERGQKLQPDAILARLDDGLERPLRDLRAAELAAAEAQLRLLRSGARNEDLKAAEAEIAALKAQEGLLAKNVARQTQLQTAGAASAQSLDQLSAELQATKERRLALEQRLKALRSGARSDELAAAEARAQAAAAGLAATEQRLLRYVLRSPVAGDVVDVHVKSGEMVAPGALAVTLADLDHPFVDVFVPQAQLSGIAVGRRAHVGADGVGRPAGAGQELTGRVEHVFSRTEFTPRFLFSDSERPNLVVRVRIRIDDPSHRLPAGVPAFVGLYPDNT